METSDWLKRSQYLLYNRLNLIVEIDVEVWGVSGRKYLGDGSGMTR